MNKHSVTYAGRTYTRNSKTRHYNFVGLHFPPVEKEVQFPGGCYATWHQDMLHADREATRFKKRGWSTVVLPTNYNALAGNEGGPNFVSLPAQENSVNLS